MTGGRIALTLAFVGCASPPAEHATVVALPTATPAPVSSVAEKPADAATASGGATFTVDVHGDDTFAVDGRSVQSTVELAARARDAAARNPWIIAVMADHGTHIASGVSRSPWCLSGPNRGTRRVRRIGEVRAPGRRSTMLHGDV